MKKTITTVLATLGVLASVSMPVMANAATGTHVNTLSTSVTTSSYTVNPFIVPNYSGTNTWGTDTLTADDIHQRFVWQVSPVNTTVTYTYHLVIDYYNGTQYMGTLGVPTSSGAGVLSGTVRYPAIYSGPGYYTGKLSGSWTGSDGTSGTVSTVSEEFGYAI